MSWLLSSWCGAKHAQAVLHPEVDVFINLSFAISVQESLAGEGFEQPLLCAPVPGSVPGYPLAQALRGQAGLQSEEGYRGEAQSR